MVAYTKPQQWKKEESERLRGERDQIKFIDLRFERWQVVGFRKARRQAYVNCILLRCVVEGSLWLMQSFNKEERERPRVEGDKIKLVDLRCEGGRVEVSMYGRNACLFELCWGKAQVATHEPNNGIREGLG